MAHFLTDGAMLRPACAAALRLYTGVSSHKLYKLPHAYAMFNKRWSKIELLFLKCFDILDRFNFEDVSKEPTCADVKIDLMDATTSLIYECAELMEDYEDNYIKTMIDKKSIIRSFKLTKKLRDHISMQCNQIKHNHASIHFVEQANRSGRIPDYVIMSHNEEGSLAPHSVIHARRESFSYAVELRIIFATMYMLGREVDDFIREHAAVDDLSIGVERINQNTLDVINRILSLTKMGFSREKADDMPLIEMRDNVLNIEMQGGTLFHGWARLWTQIEFGGDSVTTTFVLPLP